MERALRRREVGQGMAAGHTAAVRNWAVGHREAAVRTVEEVGLEHEPGHPGHQEEGVHHARPGQEEAGHRRVPDPEDQGGEHLHQHKVAVPGRQEGREEHQEHVGLGPSCSGHQVLADQRGVQG